MLTKIRSGVDHIIIRIILAIVALSFIGIGGVSFMSGDIKGTAVSFSDAESISMEKFLRTKHRKIESIQKQHGINLTEEQMAELNLNQEVLKDLISSAMVDHINQLYEFDISNKKIISFAKQSPMFFNSDGEFDPQIYKSVFENAKLNEKEYLDYVKSQALQGTISGLFALSYKVPEIMTDNMINFMAETKNATIYKMNLSHNDKAFKVGEPEKELLRGIYDASQKAFTVPEKRSFRYIKISRDFLSKEINITEQDMKKYFDENPDEFINISYGKAKKEIKSVLTESNLEDLIAKYSRKLEDDVAAGMSLEEISNKYDIKITNISDVSKNNLLNNKNEDQAELADHIFEMIAGEISYPVEVKDKHEILLTILDSIAQERIQEYSEVEEKIIELWKVRQLSDFNMNNFIKFAQGDKLSKDSKDLAKKGIKLIKKANLSRVDINDDEIPAELFSQIFKIDDKSKTMPFQGKDGHAYFAYLEKSYIDNKKKKNIAEKGLEHFQNTIKNSLLQEIIINMTMKNDVKINVQ